jgi:hypothetical protein
VKILSTLDHRLRLGMSARVEGVRWQAWSLEGSFDPYGKWAAEIWIVQKHTILYN